MYALAGLVGRASRCFVAALGVVGVSAAIAVVTPTAAGAAGPTLGSLKTAGTTAAASAVAYDAKSSSYLVASVRGLDESPSTGPQVTRVSAAGAKVDAQPRNFNFREQLGGIAATAINGRYVTVWGSRNGDVYSGTVDPASGAVSAVTELAWGGERPAMASLPSSGLVAWDAQGPDTTIRIVSVDAAGTPATRPDLPRVFLTTSGTRPAVGADGHGYLVVWSDRRNGDADIMGATVSAEGLPTSPPTVIAGGPGDQVAPSITWTGAHYVVAWSDGNIRAVRVAASGSLIDATPRNVIATAATEVEPVVVHDGKHTMVAWVAGTKASMTRLTGNGAVLGPTFLLADSIRTSQWSDTDIDPVSIAAGPSGKALITVVRANGLYYRTFAEA